MTSIRQRLGLWGESLAANYLIEKGYVLLDRNARTPYGEIDIVARQGTVIVFVEVKTRASTGYGHPEEAVTPTKQSHLIAAVEAYLQGHPNLEGDWQIDVIAIRRKKNAPVEIVHFENAVSR